MKSEIRNPKSERMSNSETRNVSFGNAVPHWHLSDFGLRISFVIRHSSFGFVPKGGCNG
jgi:hypothetical protein